MKAAIFDLDGTLIDSAPDLHAAANRVLSAENLPSITLAQARSFVGNGASVFVERMMQAVDLEFTPERHASLLKDFLGLYQSAVHLTRPYPQVIATLEALQGDGWRLGLCTNKPIGPTNAVLGHLDLARFFSVVTGGDSLPKQKPDPAPLRHTLAGLKVDRAIFIGDSEVDAQTAQAASLPFALYTPGYRKASVDSLRPAFAFDDYPALRVWLMDGSAADVLSAAQ